MNALAGGGTFATLPALIALGLPANLANASSNVALLPGAAAQRCRIPGRAPADRRHKGMGAGSAITFARGILGSALRRWSSRQRGHSISSFPGCFCLRFFVMLFASAKRIGLVAVRNPAGPWRCNLDDGWRDCCASRRRCFIQEHSAAFGTHSDVAQDQLGRLAQNGAFHCRNHLRPPRGFCDGGNRKGDGQASRAGWRNARGAIARSHSISSATRGLEGLGEAVHGRIRQAL